MTRLEAERTALGLRLEALADASGVAASDLAAAEAGTRPLSATALLYVAEVLAVDVDELDERTARHEVDPAMPSAAAITAAWFRHFVNDALFVDRTARRYGID